ncbi:MAG TPA: hypothetical protein DEB39_11545 [Planctomycetaceae bacterium]|nr:hypothetical protein [Planctomycetaceae bacterium]
MEAVMKLAPDKPYPGANLVAEALVWFARGEGINRAVAAAPKQTDAMKLAGFLVPYGFRTDTALTSGEAMRRAADSPDVELLLVDVRCQKPAVKTLVQEMRADARTHEIPVAILTTHASRLAGPVVLFSPPDTPLDQQTAYDLLAPDNPFAHSLAVTYPMPVDARGTRWMLDDLYLKTSTRPADPTVRLLQGRRALGWIREAVERAGTPDGANVYAFEDIDNLVTRATASATLFFDGVELAAVVPSARMQALLAELTAQPVFDIQTRQFVAQRFLSSIDKHGVLLRGKQVQVLYDRYNASKDQPGEVQRLLAALLDAVEEKTFDTENRYRP